MQPVTDEIAPNYSATITNPMDFSTMRRKLDANEYKNLPEFKVKFAENCFESFRKGQFLNFLCKSDFFSRQT